MSQVTTEAVLGLLFQHMDNVNVHLAGDNAIEVDIGAMKTFITEVLMADELFAEYIDAEEITANKIFSSYASAVYQYTQHAELRFADIDTAVIGKATIEDLTTMRAEIDVALVDYLKATDIVAENMTVGTIVGNMAKFFETISFAVGATNIVSFAISSKHLVVEDAFITSAMIHSIDASVVNVTNLVADNITVDTINGQKVLSTVVNETAENVDWIQSQKQYRIEVVSDQGDKLHQSVGTITLFAVVYSWDENITNDLEPSYFRWTRTSADPLADAEWNIANMGGKKSIIVTGEDVYKKATFYCDLIDPDTGLSLL